MACASHSSKHLFIQTMAARLAVTSGGAMGRYIDYTTGDLTRIMFIPVTSYTRSAGRLLRGQPSDHDLPPDEDRPGVLHAAHRADVDAVRRFDTRIEVPGPAGADALALLAELHVKVLVVGGTGFVGPKIVHALRAHEYDVRAIAHRSEHAARLANWGVELVPGDVTDPASLAAALEGCTHVVHLVAIIKGRAEDFQAVMVRGTENLVAAAKSAGVQRFVLMSALGTTPESAATVPTTRRSSRWSER